MPAYADHAWNRLEARYGQSLALLVALVRTMTAAARDDQLRVIVLAAKRRDFHAGHGLRAGPFNLPPERFDAPAALGAIANPPGTAAMPAGARSISTAFAAGATSRSRESPPC